MAVEWRGMCTVWLEIITLSTFSLYTLLCYRFRVREAFGVLDSAVQVDKDKIL